MLTAVKNCISYNQLNASLNMANGQEEIKAMYLFVLLLVSYLLATHRRYVFQKHGLLRFQSWCKTAP